MTRTLTLSLLLTVVATQGCGDPNESQIFTAEQAIDAAKTFQSALASGDAASVAKLCRTPFAFQGRTWDETLELERNWAKEAIRVKHVIADFDSYEAFSVVDLKEGRWPRNENVAEDQRAARVARLGLFENGWLVRVYSGGKPGYAVVFNTADAATLHASAIDL